MASAEYKRTMNTFINKYKRSTSEKLRNLKKKNPKSYWAYLNSIKPKSSCKLPSLSNLFEHFKQLNTESEINQS